MKTKFVQIEKNLLKKKETTQGGFRVLGLRFFGKNTPIPNPMIEAAEKFKQNPKEGAAFVEALKNEILELKRSGNSDNILITIRIAAKAAKEVKENHIAADILSCALPHYERGSNHSREKIMHLAEIAALYESALAKNTNGTGLEIAPRLEEIKQKLWTVYNKEIDEADRIRDISERTRRKSELAGLISNYAPKRALRTLETARAELTYWYGKAYEETKVNGSKALEQVKNKYEDAYSMLSNKMHDLEWTISMHEMKAEKKVESSA